IATIYYLSKVETNRYSIDLTCIIYATMWFNDLIAADFITTYLIAANSITKENGLGFECFNSSMYRSTKVFSRQGVQYRFKGSNLLCNVFRYDAHGRAPNTAWIELHIIRS